MEPSKSSLHLGVQLLCGASPAERILQSRSTTCASGVIGATCTLLMSSAKTIFDIAVGPAHSGGSICKCIWWTTMWPRCCATLRCAFEFPNLAYVLKWPTQTVSSATDLKVPCHIPLAYVLSVNLPSGRKKPVVRNKCNMTSGAVSSAAGLLVRAAPTHIVIYGGSGGAPPCPQEPKNVRATPCTTSLHATLQRADVVANRH